MITKEFVLLEYLSSGGRNYFQEWVAKFPPEVTSVCYSRILRIRNGILGDIKHVGLGVYEVRINFGPGYRIYFGFHNKQTIVLLGGGTKHRQQADIVLCRKLWLNYLERRN
jgi:putative addiction module killer protein